MVTAAALLCFDCASIRSELDQMDLLRFEYVRQRVFYAFEAIDFYEMALINKLCSPAGWLAGTAQLLVFTTNDRFTERKGKK